MQCCNGGYSSWEHVTLFQQQSRDVAFMCSFIRVMVWLSYSPLDPRFAGQTRSGSIDFSGRKNPEYDFLLKGSKAVDPVS